MAEIYTKTMIEIDGEYAAGDTVPYIRWKLDDETENEIYNAVILDINEKEGYILVTDGSIDDIKISIEDII